MSIKAKSVLPVFWVFLLAAGGCKTQIAGLNRQVKVYPELKTEHQAIDKIDIITDVKLTGYVQPQDSLAVAGMMFQTASAKLTSSGLYKTTDIIWGNLAGTAKLAEMIKQKNSCHGYAHYATESVFRRAKLYLTVEAEIRKSQAIQQKTYSLLDQTYRVFYNPENRIYYQPSPPSPPNPNLRGEARERAHAEYRQRLDRERNEWERDIFTGRRSHRQRMVTVQVPYSAPNPPIQRNVTHPVFIYSISLTGKFSIRLVDKNNNIVFEENRQLGGGHSTSEIQHNAPPTVLRLLTSAVQSSIINKVSSLTPQDRKIHFAINADKSDKRALALLCQGPTTRIPDLQTVRPFEDVLTLLEGKKQKSADDFNCIGIAYACLDDFAVARQMFEQALRLSKDNNKDTAAVANQNLESIHFMETSKDKRKKLGRGN